MSEKTPTPPEEIRARAVLPGMTLEIVHRPAGEGSPETIGLVLKGSPNLPGLAEMMALPPPASPTALADPFALWTEITRQVWAPWFALWGLSAGPSGPGQGGTGSKDR
ncbi:MAG: hypothetical protein JNN22_05195 [Rhodospirillales bacterium]|nr:hypothetical protein [Rhodospirillales bacterium]